MKKTKNLTIVRPRTRTISSTDGCFLNCAHCQGYFLKSMEDDIDLSAESFLLSGGCDYEGKVLHNIQMLKMLKENKKKVNVHCRLVDDDEARTIGKYADVVSFDFMSGDDSIKKVYNLNKSENDFIESYKSLKRYCRVVPHIIIGLGNEKRSIDILNRLGQKEACFLILIKNIWIKNNLKEPDLTYIEDILKYARKKFEHVKLGCMRPLSRKNETDKIAVKYVDSIVNPHKNIDMKKFNISRKDACCCF